MYLSTSTLEAGDALRSAQLEFLTGGHRIEDLPTLTDQCAGAMLAFGFPNFLCIALSDSMGSPALVPLFGCMSSDLSSDHPIAERIRQSDAREIVKFVQPMLWNGSSWADLSQLGKQHPDAILCEPDKVVAIPVGCNGKLMLLASSDWPVEFNGRSRANLSAISALYAIRGRLLFEQMDDFATSSPLSIRERRCLALAARRNADFEIASALSISVPSVQFHLRNAVRKLGASDRTEAISRAAQCGWLITDLQNSSQIASAGAGSDFKYNSR